MSLSLDSDITYVECSVNIPLELTKDLHRSFFENQNKNDKQRIEIIHLVAIINPKSTDFDPTYLINYRVDSFSNLVMESPHSEKWYLSNALSAMQKANEVYVKVSMCNRAGVNGGILYETTWRYQLKKNA